MSIYTRYFDELVNLVPSINDSLNLPKYKHLKNKMENPYSKEFIKKDKELSKKYLKLLLNKKEKGIYGTASKQDLSELKEEGIDAQMIPWVEDKNN